MTRDQDTAIRATGIAYAKRIVIDAAASKLGHSVNAHAMGGNESASSTDGAGSDNGAGGRSLRLIGSFRPRAFGPVS